MWIVDPDPDPAFHFNADPDPAPGHHRDRTCDHWSMEPPGFHFEPPGFHCERLRLYFSPVKLLNFDFNANPYSAFHFYADPDPAF
jgi:hypothetical protein